MGWLAQSREKSMLGQLLVQQKLISEEQLAKAIEHQRNTGQRLGDIFAEWNLVALHQVEQALRKQRNLRLAAGLAAVLLGPLEAFAAAPVPPTQISAQSTQAHNPAGLRTMTEEDLDQIAAQGLSDDLLHRVKHSSRDGGVQVLGNIAKLMNPLWGFLEADTSIRDVVYDPANAAAVINPDGSITLSMPSSIGELNFEHIRVRGSTGPSFGSISIRGIDLTGTTITLIPTSQPAALAMRLSH